MQLLSCDLWLMERREVCNLFGLAHRLNGQMPPAKCAEDTIEHVRATGAAAQQKSIAVIPVSGALEARPTELGAWLGMSSYEVIGKVFDHFVQDSSVTGIILDVSSPGGMVYGAQELAQKIFEARGAKPIVSVANPLMASGAYWLAAAADRVIVTPSGDVGSVGVIVEHIDLSKRYEQEGVTVSTIKASGSPYKAEFSDASPLTEEARQNLQSRADNIHSRFVADLARFRGVSVEHVNERFGKGRVVDSRAALNAGMVDRVGTLQEIAGKMASGRVRIGKERAQDNWDMPTRREMLKERAEAILAAAETPKEVE